MGTALSLICVALTDSIREAIIAYDRIAARVAFSVCEEFGGEHNNLGIIPRRVTTISNTLQEEMPGSGQYEI